MKKRIYNVFFQSLGLSLFILILAVSCDTNDGISEFESSSTLQTETADILEIQSLEENLDDMIESLSFDMDQVDLLKNNNSKLYISPHQIPECATISASITNNTINLILDFGEGCKTEFDNVLTGKIHITINNYSEENKRVIEQSFENFTFDDRQIEGTISKERIKRMNDSPPYSLIQKDLKIIWKNDSFSSIKSDRKREWIQGFDNLIWSDNVYLITGSSTITKKNGVSKTVLITEALRREAFCKNIVSGKLEISRGENSSFLDYGDGECDNLAILTIGDVQTIIELKRRRR